MNGTDVKINHVDSSYKIGLSTIIHFKILI